MFIEQMGNTGNIQVQVLNVARTENERGSRDPPMLL